MSVLGIDVSNDNGALDKDAIQAMKLNFIIAKATEGADIVDDQYHNNAVIAVESHLEFGAYHFFHAENLDAVDEAANFIDHAYPRNYLSLWLDYETYGKSSTADANQLELFVSTVKKRFPMTKVGLYANSVGLSRIQPYYASIGFDALWWADPSVTPDDQAATMPWNLHQYVQTGIDRDYGMWETQADMRAFFTWC